MRTDKQTSPLCIHSMLFVQRTYKNTNFLQTLTRWSVLTFRFSNQWFVCISRLSHGCCMPHPSHWSIDPSIEWL